MDDFGQIEIYETLFHDIDESLIKGNALECIENKTSYVTLYKKRELPIMVGSKFDKGPNPLKIKGYFVINGICKSINNLKQTQKTTFSSDRAWLCDGSVIKINDMFNISIHKNSSIKKWYLPLNWESMLKYSKNPSKLENFFSIIEKTLKNKLSPPIKSEIDIISLCYAFDCWLGTREEPSKLWRLVTPGEILRNCIDNERNIVKMFVTNEWWVYNKKLTVVSEDIKHYNYYSDIEAIRRVVIMGVRERATKDTREVKLENKGLLCPVHTPDGDICGTVSYICVGAKVKTAFSKPKIESGDMHIFVNGVYNGQGSVPAKPEYIIKNYGEITYVYSIRGFLNNETDNQLSYTASNIPHIYNNPPIRGMFLCSMMKQAIMYDDRKLSNIIGDVKYLENEIDFNVQTAIMPWYGYNVEDAIVISNRMALKYLYYKTKIYSLIGCVVIDLYVKPNEIIAKNTPICKVYRPNEIKSISIIKFESEYKGEVILISDNKIIVKYKQPLKVGDKLTSMNGQKGVISLIEPNMPYYMKNGVKVKIDLIINPHAFPSRMTMGQIIEMGNEKHNVFLPKINDYTKNKILVGNCKYLALRHQVDDKLQFRNGGNYDILSKQPSNALRFGQMERDILIALEAWNTIKEFWDINKSKIKWCPITGAFNDVKCECNTYKEMNQHFIICLSLLKALGYNILLKNNKYKISLLDVSTLPKTNTKYFGDLDASDVRLFKDMPMLPIIMRNNDINDVYSRSFSTKNKKEIDLIVSRLLRAKNGYYHTYLEGRKIDKYIRSVITPDPSLPIDTILVPLGIKISKYALLNRQPSLNKGSLKLIKLKHGPNKTISINPLICKTFNADFDGDEMNVYMLYNNESIKELSAQSPDKVLIQDYILGDVDEITSKGLTADKEGIKLMQERKSKGSEFNYQYMYDKIGDTKEGYIENCYFDGIKPEQWYLLAISARNHAISIALNTPVTGNVQSLVIQSLI